jgi:hypothetical protein
MPEIHASSSAVIAAKRGVSGWLERWLIPGFLRKVFAAELRQLDVQARTRRSDGA